MPVNWFEQLCSLFSERDIPLFHAEVSTDIEIKLDGEGNFLGASRKICRALIPVTERSYSRTSGFVPHPLSDVLGCIAGDFSMYAGSTRLTRAHRQYREYLEKWALSEYSTDSLRAVSHYISRGTMFGDLNRTGVASVFAPEKAEKLVVRFVVEGTPL